MPPFGPWHRWQPGWHEPVELHQVGAKSRPLRVHLIRHGPGRGVPPTTAYEWNTRPPRSASYAEPANLTGPRGAGGGSRPAVTAASGASIVVSARQRRPRT